MGNGRSRNKRGRGNPRAHYGPPAPGTPESVGDANGAANGINTPSGVNTPNRTDARDSAHETPPRPSAGSQATTGRPRTMPPGRLATISSRKPRQPSPRQPSPRGEPPAERTPRGGPTTNFSPRPRSPERRAPDAPGRRPREGAPSPHMLGQNGHDGRDGRDRRWQTPTGPAGSPDRFEPRDHHALDVDAAALNGSNGSAIYSPAPEDVSGYTFDGEEHAELTVRMDRVPATYGKDGHEPFRPEVRGEIGTLIDSLHTIFEHDRAIASQGQSTRCGLCYLHHPLAEMEYREADGYYLCEECRAALGTARVPMVRRQKR